MTSQEFINQEVKKSSRYSQKLAEEISASSRRIYNSSFKDIGDKYNIDDTNYAKYLSYFYRETWTRNHFAKNVVERYFSNTYMLIPLMDPCVRKLNFNTSDCRDGNLLTVFIYTRYCPKLLDFKFEGGRSYDESTIQFSKQLNNKYPYEKKTYSKMNSSFSVITEDAAVLEQLDIAKNNNPIPARIPNIYLKSAFDSCGLRKLFTTHFDEEIYLYAKKSEKNSGYFPMRECYSVIGLSRVIEDMMFSQKLKYPSVIDSFDRQINQNIYDSNDDANDLVARLKHHLTGRIDIKLCAEPANLSISSISDSHVTIKQPQFLQRGGVGYVIESYKGNIDIVLNVKSKGTLEVRLRGRDVRYPNNREKRIPYWINYTAFNYSGEPVFEGTKSTWHDKPFFTSFQVEEGDIIKMHVEWQPGNVENYVD